MSSSEAFVPAVRPRSAGSDDVWVIEPRGAGLAVRAREVWRSRHLLRYFGIRTLQRLYRRTFLGKAWIFLRPLVPVIISTFVFHGLAGVRSDPVPYFLFFLVGSSVWQLFEESLIWMTRSFQINRSVLKKLYFPRIILPLSATAIALVNFLIHLALIVAASLYFLAKDGTFHLSLGPGTLLAVLAMVLAFLAALGIGLFTAVIGAEYRDVRFTLQYILRFWFFLTPVVYPTSLVPEQYRWLIALNPLTTVLELFRWGLLGMPAQLELRQMLLAPLIVAIAIAASLRYFIRAEAASIDRL